MSKLDKALYGLFVASTIWRLVRLEQDPERYLDELTDQLRDRRARYISAAAAVAWVSKLALRRD